MEKFVRLKTVEALRFDIVIFVLYGAVSRQSVVLRQLASSIVSIGQAFHANVSKWVKWTYQPRRSY